MNRTMTLLTMVSMAASCVRPTAVAPNDAGEDVAVTVAIDARPGVDAPASNLDMGSLISPDAPATCDGPSGTPVQPMNEAEIERLLSRRWRTCSGVPFLGVVTFGIEFAADHTTRRPSFVTIVAAGASAALGTCWLQEVRLVRSRGQRAPTARVTGTSRTARRTPGR